jgi:hypothetical protein
MLHRHAVLGLSSSHSTALGSFSSMLTREAGVVYAGPSLSQWG